MLVEIFCDKFKSNNETRPKITFSPGLNVVHGSDNGNNSIGKSTFLMIIDFVFGGKDYVDKLTEVSNNVGDHIIYFAFQFDKMYYFYRSTSKAEYKQVYECNENYEPTGVVYKLDDYNSFLKSHYNITLPHLSFREIASKFLRIYNRENVDEKLPLRGFNDETEKSSIIKLVKLFNLFASIEELQKQYDDLDDKKDTFKKAQNFNLIPKLTKKEYDNALVEVERLTAELETLANRSDRGILEISAEKAERLAQIIEEIKSLKRKRSKYYNQINLYKKDGEYEPDNYQSDFSELLEYFDNVNIENLEEIESFHKSLSTILQSEIKKSIKEAWDNINLLNDAIRELEEEQSTIEHAPNVSKVVLRTYATIDRQIETLKKAIEYYDSKQSLDDEVKQTGIQLEAELATQLEALKTSLNSKMEELNVEIDVNTYPPVMNFPTPKTYLFTTPSDQGTGTKYKGMIVLDLAILYLTVLPVLVHDSFLYTNLSNERIEKIFDLYVQSNKQIFVAVDKTVQLNRETETLIREHTILELGPNGNELFGWSWNVRREETNND